MLVELVMVPEIVVNVPFVIVVTTAVEMTDQTVDMKDAIQMQCVVIVPNIKVLVVIIIPMIVLTILVQMVVRQTVRHAIIKRRIYEEMDTYCLYFKWFMPYRR